MTTIPYLKQNDNPITDYLKQYNKLREQVNPNIEELENFVKAAENFRFCNNDSQNINALRLKYQAMTTIPTTIQKTMSPYQLYESNNPLWAIELDALSIESFLDIEKNKGKLSKTMFNRIYEYQTQGQYSFDIETGDSITISKKGF